MSSDRNEPPNEVLLYQKSRAVCRIEAYEDGSVLVTGDEIGNVLYEWADDCLAQAIAAVERLGYVRI